MDKTDTNISVPSSALFSTLLVSESDQRPKWDTKNTATKMQLYLKTIGDNMPDSRQLASVAGRLSRDEMKQVINLRSESLCDLPRV